MGLGTVCVFFSTLKSLVTSCFRRVARRRRSNRFPVHPLAFLVEWARQNKFFFYLSMNSGPPRPRISPSIDQHTA